MPQNDAGTLEQIVLSDALTQVVGGRRVTAAVFTTFEFEPDFFELHVLPCLFPNVAWSHMPNVKRVQVGESLLGLEHAAVFYDRRGLRPEGGASRLDYERIGLARAAGVFHAKNILLLFFHAVEGMDNVHWARLPSDMTRWSRKGDKTKHRNVHAKVYRLFKGGRAKDDWRDVQIVGSVNLTGAAHAGGTVRNFETAILVDLECPHRPDWRLTPLDKPAAEFDPGVSEDDTGTLACHELTLRFHWQSDPNKERLDYFWKAERNPPQCASVWANGCRLFAFGKIVFDRWEPLDDDARQAIQQRLRTSSLVELQVESVPPQQSPVSMQPLLVQELNMAQKPPLLEGLSAAEILEYWSLLTPDQRNEYLERKLTALLERAETQHGATALQEPSESLFDRFAGIFHAFSCLEEHVLDALKRGAEKDARYRLIGTSYDSLPTLANQVKDSADAVVAYVTLLRAGEVFRRLRGQIRREGIKSDFLEKPDVKEACRRYEGEWRQACEESKGRIAGGGTPIPEGFFDWYERAFGGFSSLGGR